VADHVPPDLRDVWTPWELRSSYHAVEWLRGVFAVMWPDEQPAADVSAGYMPAVAGEFTVFAIAELHAQPWIAAAVAGYVAEMGG
jgi:hypothetical protein